MKAKVCTGSTTTLVSGVEYQVNVKANLISNNTQTGSKQLQNSLRFRVADNSTKYLLRIKKRPRSSSVSPESKLKLKAKVISCGETKKDGNATMQEEKRKNWKKNRRNKGNNTKTKDLSGKRGQNQNRNNNSGKRNNNRGDGKRDRKQQNNPNGRDEEGQKARKKDKDSKRNRKTNEDNDNNKNSGKRGNKRGRRKKNDMSKDFKVGIIFLRI